jgi:3-oxoadipate enol-lactonase
MASASSFDQGVVELPGVKLAYEAAGQGASVVLLHGGLLDKRMWDRQFAFLDQTLGGIRYDMPSAGQSETAPRLRRTAITRTFAALRALRIKRASLVGHSNNAVALDSTIACLEMVERLVLVSPGLRGYQFRDPWVESRFAAMMRSLSDGDLDGVVEVFLTMWEDGPFREPGTVGRVDRIVRAR